MQDYFSKYKLCNIVFYEKLLLYANVLFIYFNIFKIKIPFVKHYKSFNDVYINIMTYLLTWDANSLSCNLYNKFIALQSLWPQTIMCLMSFTIQPNSKAAGSFVVNSSKKCCEWGMRFPAFLTGK